MTYNPNHDLNNSLKHHIRQHLIVGLFSVVIVSMVIYGAIMTLIINSEFDKMVDATSLLLGEQVKRMDQLYMVFDLDQEQALNQTMDAFMAEYNAYQSIGFDIDSLLDEPDMNLIVINANYNVEQSTDFKSIGQDYRHQSEVMIQNIIAEIKQTGKRTYIRLYFDALRQELSSVMLATTPDGFYTILAAKKLNIYTPFDRVSPPTSQTSIRETQSDDQTFSMVHMNEVALVEDEDLRQAYLAAIERMLPQTFYDKQTNVRIEIIPHQFDNRGPYDQIVLFVTTFDQTTQLLSIGVVFIWVLLTGAVLVVLVSLSTHLRMTRLVKPFYLLLITLKRIKNGDWSIKLKATESKECNTLSEQINLLIQSVESLLNERSEREQRLVTSNKVLEDQKKELEDSYGATETLNAQYEHLIQKARDTYYQTIKALSNAMEYKDMYIKGHSERVEQIAHSIGMVLGFNATELQTLRYGALLHDIGKIGLPESLLKKRGDIDPVELKRFRDHTQIGYEIVKEVEFLQEVKLIILQHHEHIDGTGYPLGLKGDEIHYMAKVIAVADAYDAMTSERSYRKLPLTNQQALEVLIKEKDKQFASDVVDACCKAMAHVSNGLNKG